MSAPPVDEFVAGTFVVLKSDFKNQKDPPLWKIDGKSLLQKFLPFEDKGKTLYKSTHTYNCWTNDNKTLYYVAPITFRMQDRKESIVEFLRKKVKVDKEDGEKKPVKKHKIMKFEEVYVEELIEEDADDVQISQNQMAHDFLSV